MGGGDLSSAMNPLAGAGAYKTVTVTETLTISPYAELKDFPYKVVWNTITDDEETVDREEKVFLAATSPYDGNVGTPDAQFTVKSEMALLPFDGTEVVYNFNKLRMLFATEAGDIYSSDYGQTYVRIAEGPSMKKELEVSGVLRSVDDKALPRMKMAVDVYYDKNAMTQKWEDGTPDLHEAFTSDLKGAFSVTIPIRGDIQTKIGVVITLTLRCQLPQGEVFSITDRKSPDSNDGISVSTLVTIDPKDRAFQNEKQISVNRSILLFRSLIADFLTLDDDMNMEPMQTNVRDYSKFIGYSYLYRNLWDALTVVALIFDELPALLQSPTGKPLQVECNYPANQWDPNDRSHYSIKDNAIRLEEADCYFNDHSRWVALHEFGHFVDAATNGWKPRCNWSSKIQSGDKSHGGYLNQSTADSFVEGFATWFACVCQLYRKDANPYLTGPFDLSEPSNWRAWANGGWKEELSIAAVLVRAMYQFDDLKDFWKAVMRGDCDNFYGYYAMMRFLLGKNSGQMALINKYMIDAGLYRMPSGNGQYDPGEPYWDLNRDNKYSSGGENYTDANNNSMFDPGETFVDDDGDNQFDAVEEPYQDVNGDGQYDFGEFYTDLDGNGQHGKAESFTDTDGNGAWTPGEPFEDTNRNRKRDATEPYGDLMYPYDASSQFIATSDFPSFFDPTKGIGESAAYNYPNRYSILLEDNCFVELNGETVEALKVAVRLSDGNSYGYVMAPTDCGIYVGLPNGNQTGTVEISVPGGGVVYQGDVATLQERISRTAGQSAPLDAASIARADLAPEGTIAAPTGGDADASGVFVPVEISNRDAGILEDDYDPEAEIDSLPNVVIRPEEPDETVEPKATRKPDMTAAPKATAKPKATAAPEDRDHGRTPEGTTAQSPIADVAAGKYFTLGLRQDGTVVAAGDNAKGQCDVSEWAEIEAIAAGLEHSVGLTRDGTVVAAGDNELGQCEAEEWEDIVQISAGYGHTVGLKADGTVVAAGYNGDGQLNVGKWRDIIAIVAGGWHTIGLKANGTVVAAGYNKYGQCDLKKWSGIAAIAAGGWHTLGIRENGRVVSAGYGESGQRDVGKWRSVTQISASGYHTVGLVEGVPPIAVGSDEYGQCELSLWEDVIRIAAGGYHTLGLLGDGSVVAVGNNDYGQCEVANWSAGTPESYDGGGE